MKRWNGWGDTAHDHHLPTGADDFLNERIGAATRPQDAQLEDAVAAVPPSRLPEHPLVRVDAEDRLRHARGQSFPDWVALRSRQIDAYPDGVAYPTEAAHVRDLLDYARNAGVKVIPYGGGTSVAGHINPQKSDVPVLTIDMGRMNRMTRIDPKTRLATFGAGITGPDLEAALRAHGFTLGHYPQSFEHSTLGGWIAARSSGQQSLHYGRIEGLFAGGDVITPHDHLHMPPFPASAAGPDLRQMILGSEGRMGIVTEATVKISPQPERETFRGLFFPTFDQGASAVRAMVQAGLPLAMLRLSTAVETKTNLALAGKPGLINIVETLLATRGIKDGKAMLLFGYTGTAAMMKATLNAVYDIAKQYGGVGMGIGKPFGATWAKGRFRTPYLRNTLWDHGYGVDTVETATDWNTMPLLITKMESALRDTMAQFDERIHIFTHLSHTYPHGTSIYTSYVFRLAADADTNMARWCALKDAVSRAIVDNGGTISHQHGVGADHAPYLATEKGTAGMAALGAMVRHFDPDGMMNPGKLISG
jgi:alkyldihydroxyacetonephosphate synthase